MRWRGFPGATGMLGMAPAFVLAASALETGFIDVGGWGPSGTTVTAGELVGGEVRPLGTFTVGDQGYGLIPRAARWSCERRTRRFVGDATLPDGSSVSSTYAIRTPSCRRRLTLSLPRATSPGRRVRAIVRDRWRIGGVRARLCATGPGTRRRCRPLALGRDRSRTSAALRPARRGHWRIELIAPGQRVRRTLAVGVRGGGGDRRRAPARVLATGDSMILTLDALLADRLRSRAHVIRQAWAATGISKPGFDWVARARRQARSVRPAVTVVFLGAGEGFDMTPPSGEPVVCCDDPWVQEYARRAGTMMRAYSRGRRRVVWVALPAPEDAGLRNVHAAVNRALRIAADGTPRVRVLPLDHVLTPGFEYRDSMRWRGRRVRLHAGDAVHLSVGGSRIAVDLLMRTPALRRLR